MSGPSRPGSPPPEVPEEFAEAYRAAYERALAAQPEGPRHRDEPWRDEEETEELPAPRAAARPAPAASERDVEEPDTQELPQRQGPPRVGTHRGEPQDDSVRDDDDRDRDASAFERVRDSRWFVPLLLAVLVLLLVLGAYAVGKAFSGRVGGAQARPGSEPTTSAGGSPSPVTEDRPAGAWDGDVTPVRGVTARTGCTYRTGVDASGARVTYGPDHLTDGATDSTWRCDGAAIGRRITLDLGRAVPVGEVGLVPGYAKTDEANGANRYAENNRITRVRWTIGGTRVEQRMSGTSEDRSVRLLRVPRTTVSRVTLEILAVQEGPRNTTAISEITIGRAG